MNENQIRMCLLFFFRTFTIVFVFIHLHILFYEFRLISDVHTKLYQHSTQCSVALQVFLKCQPAYWCFVPMTKEQVLIDDVHITAAQRNILAQYADSASIETEINEYQREMTLVRWCVNHVPAPPLNYQFSLRQKIEQYEFFRDRSDRFLSRFLDLYNAAMVIARKSSVSMR